MRLPRDLAVTVPVTILLGVAAGLVWSYVAPRAPYLLTPEGRRLADPSTQSLIAADGWFAVVTGVLGLVCGAVGFFLAGRRNALVVLLGLTAGGLVAAGLAVWVGGLVDLGPATIAASGVTGRVVPGALVLTAPGVIVTWPLMAAVVFALLLSGAAAPDPPDPTSEPGPGRDRDHRDAPGDAPGYGQALRYGEAPGHGGTPAGPSRPEPGVTR